MALRWSFIILLIFAALCEAQDSFEMYSRQKVSVTPKEMKAKLVSFSNSAGKMVIGILREANISSSCTVSLFQFFMDLKQMKKWAWNMLDAEAKPPSGLLQGILLLPGDYDECLAVNVKNAKGKFLFQGKHCLVRFPFDHILDYINQNWNMSSNLELKSMLDSAKVFSDIGFNVGLCVPSKCNAQDVNQIISAVSKGIVLPDKIDCKTTSIKILTTEQIVILCIFSLIGLLAFTGTCLDIIQQYTTLKIPSSGLYKFSLFFSLYSNTIRLFSSVDQEDSLTALRGCRVLSITWIVLLHTYYIPDAAHFLKYRGLNNLNIFSKQLFHGTITGGILAIDTFFLLSCMLFVNITLKKLEKNGRWVDIITLIVRRFLGFIHIQTLFIAIILLSPLFIDGPLSHLVFQGIYNACKTNWWVNILSIQNFWPNKEICLPQTWFIAALFQILMSLFWIVLVFHRWPKIGIAINVFFVVIGCLLIGLVTSYLDLPSIIHLSKNASTLSRYFEELHIRPYAYLSSCCIGFILGYAVFAIQNPIIKLRVQIILWLSAISGALVALFSSFYIERDNREMDIVYAALHRAVWCCSIAWMLFACIKGYGGIINQILSWKGMIPLDRLCLMIYLLNPLTLGMLAARSRVAINLGRFEQLILYAFAVTSTILISSMLNIVYEQPLKQIESYIFSTFFRDASPGVRYQETVVSPIKTQVSTIKIKLPSSKAKSEEIKL